MSCYIYECLSPLTIPYNSLLIEYKEAILNKGIAVNVIPTVDHNFILIAINFFVGTEKPSAEFLLPFKRISFLGGCNDI